MPSIHKSIAMNNANNNGLRPALQTRVASITHPSQCTGNPYSQDLRDLVLFIRSNLNENHPFLANLISLLQNNHLYPHETTRWRWEQLDAQLGHHRPCRRTGNKFATRLTCQDLILLALYRSVYPKAIAAEVNAFLYKANIGNPSFYFYLPIQITKAGESIGISRKKGSTTAYKAYYPVNLRKR